MNVAFLTEMGFQGKVPEDHPNARTEFAWMITLNADHYNIYQFQQVKNYDAVFVILPKGIPKLNMVGVEMKIGGPDKDMGIYSTPIIEVLKSNNKKVCYVQEGPAWFFNDYTLDNQFNFYNQLIECDVIFAHNKRDRLFYMGLFPGVKVEVIPTLMIENLIKNITPKAEEKVMVGGNFARWYGGFQSYIVASRFGLPMYTQTSHCMQNGEDQVPNLTHLPRLIWKDWMEELSKFKYAVHLMPTPAAGTFSLNCAYFGIPCIGNHLMDTQYTCFPSLSVDVNDVYAAKEKAENICTNKEEYDKVSKYSMEVCRESYHIDKEKWIEHIKKELY